MCVVCISQMMNIFITAEDRYTKSFTIVMTKKSGQPDKTSMLGIKSNLRDAFLMLHRSA